MQNNALGYFSIIGFYFPLKFGFGNLCQFCGCYCCVIVHDVCSDCNTSTCMLILEWDPAG